MKSCNLVNYTKISKCVTNFLEDLRIGIFNRIGQGVISTPASNSQFFECSVLRMLTASGVSLHGNKHTSALIWNVNAKPEHWDYVLEHALGYYKGLKMCENSGHWLTSIPFTGDKSV